MNNFICNSRDTGKSLRFKDVAESLEKHGNIKVYIIEDGLVLDITKFPTSKTILSIYGLRRVVKITYKEYKLCDDPDEKVFKVYLAKEAKK